MSHTMTNVPRAPKHLFYPRILPCPHPPIEAHFHLPLHINFLFSRNKYWQEYTKKKKKINGEDVLYLEQDIPDLLCPKKARGIV